MNNLALHPTTKQLLDVYVSDPGHALIINGPRGSGKGSVSINLAERLLGKKASNNPGLMTITKDKDSHTIGIEAIRKLNRFLSLKVASKQRPNRIAIIEDADLMTTEAQNALLKTLEEPPFDTVLILTVSNLQAILPTVRSRVNNITLTLPSKESIRKVTPDTDNESFEQAYAISGGSPGLLMALLGEDEHPLKSATASARELLTKSAYDRLILIDKLSKDKEAASDTLVILMQMADRGLQLAKDSQAISKWHRVLEASYKASESLKSNGQPKLVLTNLALNL